jgi:PilZ domain
VAGHDHIPRSLIMTDRRKTARVRFNSGVPVYIMGIDGTWRRACIMEDASDDGAKLRVEGSVEGLYLTEFFLLLSSTGLAYRRCELAWVNGEKIGVRFLKHAGNVSAIR